MRNRCYFPEIVEQLRETLRHLDTLQTIGPHNPDVIRLKEALRERVDDLEHGQTLYQEESSMAAD